LKYLLMPFAAIALVFVIHGQANAQACCADTVCAQRIVGDCDNYQCMFNFTGNYGYNWADTYAVFCSGGGYATWQVKIYWCLMGPVPNCEYDPDKSNLCVQVSCTDCDWRVDLSQCTGTPLGSPSYLAVTEHYECCTGYYEQGVICWI